MTFWDHLEALRWCFFRVLIALVAVFVGVFAVLPSIFDDFILGAASADFFAYRLLGRVLGAGSDVQIININVASQFLTHMSTSLWIALLVVFPYLLYQLWVFVKPALYPGELRGVRTAFLGGTLLFYLGCALSYTVIFPITFKFLTQYKVSADIVNQISLNSYMSVFLTMIFVMGVVFELPVLAWMLSALGVLHKGVLKRFRKHAVVALLVLAAIITPTGDPFTLSVVFLPLYLLYEFSILIVRPDEEEDDKPAPEPDQGTGS
ncbi:MAG: twin-arginine translocase subunit TatC [Bacteroidales bacterium]|nr:twin-arginine translocase subunit TatC [Bacteroidales bacterium]